MNIDLLRENVTPSEGEMSVRAYHCTYYRSHLLGLHASGYLAVTNKRVLFQALGKTSVGQSIIQSEVPIADVSGINSYKGTHFSFGRLFLAFMVASFVFTLVPILLGAAGNFDMRYDDYKSTMWALAIISALVTFIIPSKLLLRTILATTSIGVVFASTGGLFGRMDRDNLIIYGLAIYTLICIVLYARRPTFSLSIGSKGGSSTPINISGVTGLGILDMAAGRALTAEPAEEAETMLRELGAVVLDIQTLGDFGIEKWKVN